ncbi:MAG: uracil-DNA glycosylase [Acidobacteriota bacterium]|nr:uracil-DNA glycosylase [Acidobacteriota bacterium]
MHLADLQEYMTYMSQLGFTGLALETDPFILTPQRKVPAPRLVVTPKADPPSKPKGPNLVDIMESVNLTMTEEDTQTMVNGVTGNDPVEVLRNLYKIFRSCESCALGTTRRKFVFGEGPHNARLMFVGEAPGEDEDVTGRPFVGAAGKLLTRIIEAMNLSRNEVFITNVVKCRPAGDRPPLPDEIGSCSPVLVKQIETVKPEIIVALGATAFRFFKGGNGSIMRGRGNMLEWRGIPVMPTFHPAYILRNPRSKREVWEDMKKVIAILAR